MTKKKSVEIICRVKVPETWTAHHARREVSQTWHGAIFAQGPGPDCPDVTIKPTWGKARDGAGFEEGLRIAMDALWRIAGFACNTEKAPSVEDYDDMESAYSNGEDVSLWDDGVMALEALARMGDRKAARELARCRRMEDERDAEQED